MTVLLDRRPAGELTLASGMAEQAVLYLLGTVAPRDRLTRQLGERRWRLELLHEQCDRQTFSYVVPWLASEQLASLETKRNYADDIRQWAFIIKELCGMEPFYVEAVTPDVLTMWRQWAAAEGYKPKTVSRRLDALGSLIEYTNWRFRAGIVSPISRLDRPKIDPNDQTTATPILEVDELQDFIAAAETPRQAFVPALIYTLAGPVSECCNAGLHHLKSTGAGRKLDLRRKGGKGREWPLPDPLCALGDVAFAGRLLDDRDQPMDRHAVDRLLNRLGRKAGLLDGRDVTPHMLRASKLMHMYDQGSDVEEIRQFADHSSVQTTLRYIRRRADDKLKAKHAAAAAVYDHIVARWIAPSPA